MPELHQVSSNSLTTALPQISSQLPPEVVTCLRNARFLHLATSASNTPHISLMNYTYLPSTPWSPSPSIIMTTPPSTTKTTNLTQNPKVSLLVHDWISHRPPTLSSTASQDGEGRRTGSPGPPAARSSLATLLLGMNTASLSRISVTINGLATFVEPGSEQESWLKARHLDNNTFGDDQSTFSTSPPAAEEDGGKKSYIEGEEVRVVKVAISDGRISDWQGTVQDWVLEGAEAPAVNGGAVR